MVPRVSLSRIIAVWLLIGGGVALPLEAGVVMSLRTTDYSSLDPRVEDTRMAIRTAAGGQAQGIGLLKMDITSSAKRNHTLVFRGGESSSITVLNHREKSFSVIDRESIAAFGAEMRVMMAATSMRVETLPPEQRAIVKKMLESQLGTGRGKTPEAKAAIIRTSDRKTLSGLPCVKYEVFQGGKKLREVWIAPPAAVRGGESALALLRQMSDFYGTLMASFDELASGLGGGFGLNQNPFEDLARMRGFPVLTRNFSGGRINTEVALLAVDERRVPAAEFETPEGYLPVVAGAPEPTK